MPTHRLPPAVRQWRAIDPRNRQARHEGHRILTRWRWARGQWQDVYWSTWELESGAKTATSKNIQDIMESRVAASCAIEYGERYRAVAAAEKALEAAEAQCEVARLAIARSASLLT